MKLILVLAAMVLGVAFAMLMGALLVAIVAAMFLELPFSHGWERAWDNKGYLILFVLILLPMFAGRD